MIAQSAETHSLDQIKNIPVPTPDDRYRPTGSHWKGVKHHDLLTALGKSAQSFGYRPVTWRVILWYGDLRLSAAVKLARRDEDDVPGKGEWIGVNASNGGDSALQYFAGTESNGVPLVHDSWAGPRYTTGFELATEADRSMNIWKQGLHEGPILRHAMTRAKLPDQDYYRMLVEVGREDILPWTKLERADTLWCVGKGKSLWDFHVCCAGALALTSGPAQMENSYSLTALYKRSEHFPCKKGAKA